MNFNKYIDHTALKANVTNTDIEKLCYEAIEHSFATVCVNPTRIAQCKKSLEGSDVKVCTVIGFPLGAYSSEVKVFETKNAITLGADEVDMVINIQALLDNDLNLVKSDIEKVLEVVRENNSLLKVIIESALLNDDQIRSVCLICKELKVDFVKTSTGFNGPGANIEVVKLMKKIAGNDVKIKASGGIKNKEDALNFIKAGASRIGTSSGVQIIKGLNSDSNY